MKKKLFALVLCVIMVVTLAVPAFAETSNSVFTGNEVQGIIAGFNHGRQLGCNAAGTYVLNQYTNAAITLSNTSVTTWKDTRAASQFWEIGSTDSGAKVYCAWNNHNVALNIYRGSSTPEVNVYTISGNFHYDSAFEQSLGIPFTIKARPRLNIGTRYIAVTTQNTSASDGRGTSKIVRWTTTPSYFYDLDMRQVGSTPSV